MESRCRTTTGSPDTCNPGVKGNPSDLIRDLVSRGAQLWMPRRTLSSGTWTKMKPRRWSASKRGKLRAGGPPVEATRARKAAVERTLTTPPPKKTRTAAPEAMEEGWCPATAGPTVVGTSHAESQRHGTSGAFATCTCDHPSLGKFLKCCFTSLRIVAWICSSAHPGRQWPAYFDQTCGYKGEEPLTTLDSPGAPAISLTPTQEIRTCDMVRRKTKEKRFGNELRRACESSLQPKQNGLKCTKCHA